MDVMLKDDFVVFERYKKASTNAFGSKKNPKAIVSDADKEKYTRIHDCLKAIVEKAMYQMPNPESLKLKAMNYSSQYGSRGHRPVDMWMSICGVDSDDFARMPQIYIIASERGIEIGFAVSISENDYYDIEIKQRNRMIVPRIVSKLPTADSDLIEAIRVKLDSQSEKYGNSIWHFNRKARLIKGDAGFDEYDSLQSMISKLKTSADITGGGSIAKFITVDEINYGDVEKDFFNAAKIFYPMLMACQPSSLDKKSFETEAFVQKEAETITFDVDNIEDARKKALKMIAVRRGQKTFRDKLLKAYEFKCAVSGCSIIEVLEAAHILPYRGDHTNHVTNGILLRADIHTLFDLGLIKVNPNNYTIAIDPVLENSIYKEFKGRKLSLPSSASFHPNKVCLNSRWLDAELS